MPFTANVREFVGGERHFLHRERAGLALDDGLIFGEHDGLVIEDLDAEAVQRERDVLIEQAKASGKPQEIAEKMVEGRMKKYYQEVVLLEQTSVIDGETKIADVIANAAKDSGTSIELTAFARFNLGEGIEKEETDFAAEVAAQLS